MPRVFWPPLVLLASIACATGCGSERNVTAPSGDSQNTGLSTSLVFSQLPIPLGAIEFVVPIGNLNPPDHTLPTDHSYFYHRLFQRDAPAYDVVAPAAGVVRSVQRENDDKVRVQATPAQTYYLAHVRLDPTIVSGAAIVAGQHLGVTSNLSFGIDLGLSNENLTLGFVAPMRYSGDTLHAESPLKYFAEPMRGALYAKERGTGVQPDGRIDFDRAGSLAGNWFLDGLAGPQSTLFGSGAMQLAFVRDVDDPSAVRISIGGTLSMFGAFAVGSGSPDPATVTPGSGTVGYRLFFAAGSGAAQGLLIVEMISASRLRAETFPGSQAAIADFTDQARIYVR